MDNEFVGPVVSVQKKDDELYETTVEMSRLADKVIDSMDHPFGYALELAEEVKKFLKLAGWTR